jgi:release factor glutamine methyltransferase
VSGQTVAALRRELARRLAPSSQSAALDARLIVAHATGIAPAEIILHDEAVVTADAAAMAVKLAERRAAGEPVARILGEKEFYGLAFALSAATLVPRPDTETLVDAVLADSADRPPSTILDLGTGSGAILIALLARLPAARGVGVDAAPAALDTASANAVRHGVAGRAAFVAGNWMDGIDGVFDVIVSNPPYVVRSEIAALAVDVRDHDPHLALDGGEDGLAAYYHIIPALEAHLAPQGRAYLEIGAGQAAAVAHMAEKEGLACRLTPDLAGIERVAILARRHADVPPPFNTRG